MSSPKMALTEPHLSVELVRSNSDKIYVFGDNLLRRGKAGQAIIRGEPNAFGVPTKRWPSMLASSFFSDQPEEIDAVLTALRELYALSTKNQIVFPSLGLGTGLAQMPTVSPAAYRRMCDILTRHFGFNQLALK